MVAGMTHQSTAWTGPVILTLCIAVLSFAVSAVALTWQVVSWRRSGPRLAVRTKWGFAGSPPDAVWFISIEVKNSGRLGTEVDHVGFQLSRRQARRQIVAMEDVLGLPIRLPIALAPGASARVMYSVPGLLGALRRERVSGKRARPYVDTGHGRRLGKRIHLGKMLHELNRPV
jgi:hypothetical protein